MSALDKHLSKIFSLPALALIILIGFIPILWPLGSKYGGYVWPVVKNVDVSLVERTDDGLIIDVSFDKVRSCEFLGVSWYDQFGDRVLIKFDLNDEEGLPTTRPVRNGQNAGPWKLIGIDELDGSVAIVSHRCHPLWITFTKFWP